MDVEVDAVASLRCNDVFSNHQRSPRSHCSHCEMHPTHFILSFLALLISFSFLSSTAFLPSRPSVRLMLRRHADASVRETLQARVLEGVNAERMLKSAIVSEKENKVFVQTSSSAPLAHPTHCSGIILLCLYTIKPQTPIDFVNQSLGLLVDCSSPERAVNVQELNPEPEEVFHAFHHERLSVLLYFLTRRPLVLSETSSPSSLLSRHVL